MGMTIDEAIKYIEYLEKFSYVKQDRESFITAIDTMRKYQQIERMLYEYKDMIHAPCLMKGHKCAVYEILNEVVEDGKID